MKSAGAFQVVYEDNHLLVVNKAAGIATMGALAGTESLVDLTKRYLIEKYNKPGNAYLGIVSRLDSVTSGLVVLARTSKAAARLNQQFAKHSVQKGYLAAVPSMNKHHPAAATAPVTTRSGPTAAWPEIWDGRWLDWVWKDDLAHRMRSAHVSASAPGPPSAQKAELQWKRLGRVAAAADILLLHLLTGRKHQIRVQCAGRGLPILGDRKYDSSLPFPAGIALHSWSLRFVHPVGQQPLAFRVPPPKSWQILGRFLPEPEIVGWAHPAGETINASGYSDLPEWLCQVHALQE